MKITPEIITELKEDEVFVFGSNEAGRHGGGAARLAHQKFGAVMGVGFGHQGQSFAIPTLDWQVGRMDLSIVEMYISRFLNYAAINPELTFYVTKIGCGIAGYEICDIAHLFLNKFKSPNVALPREFVDYFAAKCPECGLSIHDKNCCQNDEDMWK
jgi:hypothetical protein